MRSPKWVSVCTTAAAIAFAALFPRPFEAAGPGGLSFEQRVQAQEAIQRVLYGHQLWPEVNPGPKPPFEELFPKSRLEGQVREYLKASAALEEIWQRPLTPEQLQAEMGRMAARSQRPDQLAELFAALGDDPRLIAECLARPLLADRLCREWFAFDDRFQGDVRGAAAIMGHRLTAASFAHQTEGQYRPFSARLLRPGEAPEGPQDEVKVTAEELARWTDRFPARTGEISSEETPDAFVFRLTRTKTADRLEGAVLVLPKHPYDAWFEALAVQGAAEDLPAGDFAYCLPSPPRAAAPPPELGAVPASPDGWQELWYVPEPRTGHAGVWTGTEMIVWGGATAPTGARYTPATGTWVPTSTLNAPPQRSGFSTVWTGSEMMVWGGYVPATPTTGWYNTDGGASYNPSTDTWTALGQSGSLPEGRQGHTAVWTGTEMIIFAGHDGSAPFSGGARYLPTNGTWTTTQTVGQPSARWGHSAVWTGKYMVVWGGATVVDMPHETDFLGDGAAYNPANDTWTALPGGDMDPGPDPRYGHTAVWTGERMIIWGGSGLVSPGVYAYFRTGKMIEITEPIANQSWTSVTTTGAPTGRTFIQGVWTGTEMLVWGGTGCFDNDCTSPPTPAQGNLNTGGRFNPINNSWTTITTTGAPTARNGHTTLWTGAEMLVWGGASNSSRLNNGGRYSPTSGTWAAIAVPGTAPEARERHTSIWTGTQMIVWGGRAASTNQGVPSGARYTPSTDSWTALSTTGAPTGRYDHTAVYTGTSMVVWGGWIPNGTSNSLTNTGGVYNISGDTWTPTDTADADTPAARSEHTAVWTGTEMLVWGGNAGAVTNTGSRFNPTGVSPNIWQAVTTTGAPAARSGHAAVWTGSQMLVWGGSLSGGVTNTGGKYTPGGSWSSLSTTGAPSARKDAAYAWTGSELVVWGGNNSGTYYNTGARYNASSDAWTATPTAGAPTARLYPEGVWTGRDFIVWGGLSQNQSYDRAGGVLDLTENAWRTTSIENAPLGRYSHTLIWTGSEMVLWDGGPTGSGGIYYPNTPPVAGINHLDRTAVYYSAYGCPRCSGYGASCDTGPTLVAGRDTMSGGAEQNQPNTLGSTCADGTSGTYMGDESVERLKVVSADGGFLTQGLPARIEATVWAYSTTSDFLDLYYTTNPSTPSWVYLTTLTPAGTGLQTLSATFTLPTQPNGSVWMAVRAQFRFQGGAGNPGSPCLTGTYNDRDDLVFPTYPPFSMGYTGNYYTYNYGCSTGSNPASATPYSDKLDAIVSYEWDFNGDAGFGTACQTATGVGVDYTGATVTSTLSSLQSLGIATPGIHPIWLRVRDEGGLTSCVSTSIPVTDAIPPTAAVVSPNGGESWDYSPATTDRRHHLVLWDASDNFPPMGRVKLSYSTNGGATWACIADSAGTACAAGALTPSVGYYDWSMPTKTEAAAAGMSFPSVNARIRVEAWDTSGNAVSDTSDASYYIIQPTAGAVQTVLVTHSGRLTALYGSTASNQVLDKLLELSTHDKVTGTLLDLNNVPALTTPYADWVADPTSVPKANAVADGVRSYLVGQLQSTFTNARYLVLAGDDRVIPHRRMVDGTLTYPETQYAGQVDCNSTVGAAICANYYLADGGYGDFQPEVTTVGNGLLYLPDLAVGRLVETPQQMMDTMSAFIAQNGTVALNKVLVTGYDFLEDSAGAIRDAYAAGGEAVTQHIGASWTATDLEASLFTAPTHALHNLNDHSDHYTFGTPSGLLDTAQMDTHGGRPLEGSLFYNVGCHSGLSTPNGWGSAVTALDLPELMLKKGAAAYIGNTGFGWGLRYGIGYSERLMQLITARLLAQPAVALGDAFRDAKLDYFLENHRFDVFDEKSLMESTLYGLPMYEVAVDPATLKAPAAPLSASGPDRQVSAGIAATKALGTAALPPGVTELDLNFDFSAPGVYTKTTTPDGAYWSLNGKTGGEIGDAVQPLFTYDSRLSGTLSHGVLFLGGSYVSESPFQPVVGTPASNNPPLGEGPIAPAGGSFIPTVNATNPTLFSFAAAKGAAAGESPLATQEDLTQMTVYTGYYSAEGGGTESRFLSMDFAIFYSTSPDKDAPLLTDPGAGGDLHDLAGLTASFSVQASDASGVYRVLVVYNDGLSAWKNFDLAYNASTGRWEGSHTFPRETDYLVYAVDNVGNVGYLESTGQDLDENGQPTGSSYSGARLFTIAIDGAADGDLDGYSNAEEDAGGTDPSNPDTDGDGESDGSEGHNGRDPNACCDGLRLSLRAAKSGGHVALTWAAALPPNGSMDGPYWVYRSADPSFEAADLLTGTPLADGVVAYTDTSAPAAPLLFYRLADVPYTDPPPAPIVASPSSGPAAGGTAITVFGTGFVPGCTITLGGAACTSVVVVNANTLTAVTPAGTAGAKELLVRRPNDQYGKLAGGFTYN